MRFIPVLFNTPMVCAIEEGRKTQTRRIVKGFGPGVTAYRLENHPVMQSSGVWEFACKREENGVVHDFFVSVKSPYQVGDILWVRETWMPVRWAKPQGNAIPADWKENGFMYYATDEIHNSDGSPVIWKPSIHMPREAARIFLRVKNVRCERLQFITEDDAMAEGVNPEPPFSIAYPYIRGFISVWEKTIPKAKILQTGWDANPWVWVIEFERMEGPPAGFFADRDTAAYADAGALMPAT